MSRQLVVSAYLVVPLFVTLKAGFSYMLPQAGIV